jgi:lysophospholipase L1-like esterase
MVGFDPLTERVKERNKIALEAISGHGIAINDLFASAELHPEYYTGGDGVHLNKDGVNALAAQVASVIEQALAN